MIWYRVIKRLIDLVLTLFLAPIWITLSVLGAVVVIVVSPGNPFYVSSRIGRHNKEILIYKIRTMVKDADKIGTGVTALGDPRIIRFGRFLRLTKIDEMPQFVSVLKGDLAIVGPRPELAEYVADYSVGEREKILSVKPGMVDFGTLAFPDLQSVLGADASDDEILKYFAKEKIRLRLYYVEEQSLYTDFKILIATPISILKSVFKNAQA